MARQTRMLSVMLMLVLAGTAAGQWLPIDKPTPTPPTITILSNTDGGTLLDVVVHGVTSEPRTVGSATYDVISLPGNVAADLDVGKPMIPKLALLLGIPDGASVTASMISQAETTFDSINCYPYQGPQVGDSVYRFSIDSAFYAKDVLYPNLSAQVASTGEWRDWSVASVLNYPVKYDPATRQLLVCSHFVVSVSYLGGAYSHKLICPWAGTLYAHYIDNFYNLDWEVVEDDPQSIKYLIICHDDYSANGWLDSLRAWHDRRGIKTRYIHKPSWDSLEVRDSIRAEYARNPELHWVLLVGEHDEVPVCDLPRSGSGDFPYSDLERGPLDRFPEVGLSRLSVENPIDRSFQIQKILKYERNPPQTNDWLTKHALIACEEGYPHGYSDVVRANFAATRSW